MARFGMVIDTRRCVGCMDCVVACKTENKVPNGLNRDWIVEATRGTYPDLTTEFRSERCNHCSNPTCVTLCPTGASHLWKDTNIVLVAAEKCTGCKACVDSCPYHAIFFNENLNIAQKCTGCAHLLDRGGVFKEPRCVDACAPEALKFGEESEFSELISQAEILHPEYGLSPRVYYLNLPRKFIAGTVYSPVDEEVVIGATCTLTGEGDTFTQITNDWGDFWFDGLKVGTYSLKIETGGKTKTISNISTEKDVGLGDIALDY